MRPQPDLDWPAAYAAHAQAVFRFARVVVRDEDDAWDVTQTVFERAYRHRDRYDTSRPLLAWLLGITHREALQLLRRRRLRPFLPLASALPAVDEPDSEIWAAVQALPAGHRAVIGLYHLYGFSTEEVADLLGIPAGTVASRLHHARRRLRTVLAADRPTALEKALAP